MVGTILMCFAFVLLVICAVFIQQVGRVHLGWLGLALWVLALLLGGAHTLLTLH